MGYRNLKTCRRVCSISEKRLSTPGRGRRWTRGKGILLLAQLVGFSRRFVGPRRLTLAAQGRRQPPILRGQRSTAGPEPWTILPTPLQVLNGFLVQGAGLGGAITVQQKLGKDLASQ